MGPLASLERFGEWLRGLGVLRVFWAKPVRNVELVFTQPSCAACRLEEE